MREAILAGAIALAVSTGWHGLKNTKAEKVQDYDLNYQEIVQIEDVAHRWGVDAERLFVVYEGKPELLSREAVESVGGFNPFSVDFADYEALERSALTENQAYKWLRYRREEIGVCFEDEEMSDLGVCVVEE